ncbi:hypothetical protein F2Q68_00032120 [Brassica cretica]|uniref:Uncharacterized protein n=2 Tax=Brassica TaxID=3705 RepID=A0A8S9G644_BRACR|nr:hypothetical protein F2Q68_00032120 [Brassica cretica]KAG2246927.1 hypothetical protein Bca52824_086555 [Brassica carinata]
MINNREDEGGGDICRRRREDIFGVASKARRSFTRKVHSDSRLLHRSVTRGRKVIQAATKNLGKELDAEHNKKMSDMVALGYDKQVAAVCSKDGSKVNAWKRERESFLMVE